MYLPRAKATKKLPVPRKGTKYLARARSHVNDAVTVVVALRDMLGLAHTAKEVKGMIHRKQLRINGKDVKDYRDSVKLFNILQADKPYMLTLTSNGRFKLEETKAKERIARVNNKKLLAGKQIQLNLHDGSNILTKDKINTHDTVYLDEAGKLKKHVAFEKGKPCIIISGKYTGKKGKIQAIENKIKVSLEDIEESKQLDKGSIVVL